jgi:hypothetical protein
MYWRRSTRPPVRSTGYILVAVGGANSLSMAEAQLRYRSERDEIEALVFSVTVTWRKHASP